MFETTKLRPDFSITGIMQPVIALALFAVIWALFGIGYGLLSMGLVFGIYAILSLAYLMRTGNPWFMATCIYQSTIIAATLLAPKIGLYAIPESSFKPLLLLIFVEMAVLVYIMAAKKLKWRGWELLELAARNVNEATNGFTERPRPLGKIRSTKYELSGFSDHLKSKLIAFTIEEEDRIVIIPITTGNEYRLPLGFSNDYSENTRVEIGFDGNVSAIISKKDYLRYKEALSFDQLVEALGQLFIDFFELYQKGEQVRIMYEVSKIKASIFN
ncbi:MAG: hypothetical protein ABFS05_02825 [Bacteroidota bacterium]